MSNGVNRIDCKFNDDEILFFFFFFFFFFYKLLILLYADDTVIFSDDASGLQKALNVFQEYCTKYKLSQCYDD